jgi:hypothetical protein
MGSVSPEKFGGYQRVCFAMDCRAAGHHAVRNSTPKRLVFIDETSASTRMMRPLRAEQEGGCQPNRLACLLRQALRAAATSVGLVLPRAGFFKGKIQMPKEQEDREQRPAGLQGALWAFENLNFCRRVAASPYHDPSAAG